MLARPWAFVRHMNKHRIVFGRRSLAASMRNQVEPSRSDGLFAAGALWVGGHCFSLPCPHYLGHHLAILRVSSVVRVSSLTMTVPDTVASRSTLLKDFRLP